MNEFEQTIARVLRKEKKVLAGYLYGSVARGSARKDSDIDVAVFLRDGARISPRFPAQLALKLERALRPAGEKREVEVQILNETPVRFRFQVFKEGKRVFERSPRTRVMFETSSLKLYYDIKPFHDHYEHMRARRYSI